MPPAVLLHLTDLHFGWDKDPSKLAARTNVLRSLIQRLEALEPEWKPSVICISGDIGWSGSRGDYDEAEQWFKDLLGRIGVPFGNVVVCAGNHDIDRQRAKKLGRPADASEADDVLGCPIASHYLDCFAEFSGFCQRVGIKSYSLGDAESYLVGHADLQGIRFVALNSAWFCRRDDDQGKLWVGFPHLQKMEADGQLQLTRNSTGSPVVALIHHPDDWWHASERHAYENRPNSRDYFAHRCHLILNGHTHGEVRRADRIAESAWHLTGGSAYAGAEHCNSFRVIQLEHDGFRYRSFEFDPRSADNTWRDHGPSEFLRLREHPSIVKTPQTASLSPPVLAISFYLRRLAEQTANLTLLSMGRSLQIDLPIADAFVPLRTTLARSLELRPTDRHREGLAAEERNVELGEVCQETARLGLRGIVLLGEPGSGKTTGARQMAWRLASRKCSPADLGLPAGMTPVLLCFRNLSRDALAEKHGLNGLRRFLDEETHGAGAPDGQRSPGPDLWNGKAGGLLWILDGLDEVVNPAVRQTVAGWVRKALAERLDDWFLVTCRFQGYFREGVPLGSQFAEYHVRALDDAQIHQFVRSWFHAAHGKLLGAGSRAETKAQSDSDQLLGILARPAYQLGHIRELCTNPLLLTILCIVFHEERKLPTGRAELYAHCVRVLLEYWRRDVYTSDLGTTLQPYDAEAAQAVLARVAWWLHQQEQRTTAPLSDLAAEATLALEQVSPSSGLGRDGADFLERMRTEAGILAMGGEGAGTCGFLHLSFQEYLAAEHAAREGLARELAWRASDSWWREVALLSLRRSRSFCEAFFREMLAAGIVERNADLAERCLQEALYFVSSPFVEELYRAESPSRVAAILRLFRERTDQVPELHELCLPLAKSADAETRGFATEILVRFGYAPPQSAPQSLDLVIDENSGVTFVVIPAGEFRMGSTLKYSDEQPVHAVRISKSFLLGKYPVTNAQYARFLESVGDKVSKPPLWDDRKYNQSEQPVVGVSWDEAQAYCAWASGRLPTEAEWEYACRAGTTTEYCFGDDEQRLGEYGWYSANSNNQLQPVGAKKPNDWGLHDMHGNVWEWCQDWKADNYYAQSPPLDPPGPDQGVFRVIRGGSWFFPAEFCRSSYRGGSRPSDGSYLLGFRVARSPSVQ